MNLRNLFFNKFSLIAAVLLIAGAGYYFWENSRTQSNEARYRTQIVERGDLTQLASANGTLNPVVLVNVGTQVSGTVKKWYVDFNDHVKEGQKLLELDPALYAAQVQQTSASLANVRSQLKLAEANAARANELFRQEYISRQELDTSVQALEAARAQVALVSAQLQKDNTNLGYSVIRSPVSGVVVSREVDIGQTVAASFQTPTLFKIAQDLSKMQIDSSFAEADVGNIKVGQPVNFRVDAFPNRSFRGSVKQVRLNPTTQQNVVTYDVVIAVDNPDQSLMPGMTAYVNIVVAQRKNVLLVPNAALRFRPAEALRPADKLQSGDKPQDGRKEGRGKDKGDSVPAGTVYLLDNGQLKPVKVTVGITDNRRTEVTGGDLAEGAAVVVEDRQPPAKTGGPPGMRLF
jgi:HlyD family secretion protein